MELVSISNAKQEKQVFTENIKRWVLLDTHIKRIQERVKELKEERSELDEAICSYLAKHNMQEKKIEIHDGEIRCAEKKDYTPLSYSYLEKVLLTIVNESSTVERILQCIKDQRQVKTRTELRRTYTSTEDR